MKTNKKDRTMDVIDQESYNSGFNAGMSFQKKKGKLGWWSDALTTLSNKSMGMALIFLSGTILGTGLGNGIMTLISCVTCLFIGVILIVRRRSS